jgi:DNA-binding CsgD family transcriptional regulator
MTQEREADGSKPLPDASIALERLSPAERRVFDLALLGLSTKEIADELVLSEATIRGHLTRIYAKLGVQGRIEGLMGIFVSGGRGTLAMRGRQLTGGRGNGVDVGAAVGIGRRDTHHAGLRRDRQGDRHGVLHRVDA